VEINKMIAIVEPSDEQISMEFQQLLPELVSRLRRRLFSKDSDLQDERAAEGMATAWATFLSARRRGRKPSASNLAFYSSHCVLAGRRLAGATSLDALSETRVAKERIGEHVSLDDFEGDPKRAFYRTFGDRRWRWPVVDIVGTKLDWNSFMSRFGRRDQRIIELKLDGYRQAEIATELRVSAAFVCQRLREIRQLWDNKQAVA
jgi:hypothetical protein